MSASTLSSARVRRNARNSVGEIGINTAGKRVTASKNFTLVGRSRTVHDVNRIACSLGATLRRKDALISETALKACVGCVGACVKGDVTDINSTSVAVDARRRGSMQTLTIAASFLTVTKNSIYTTLNVGIVRNIITLIITATICFVTRDGRAFRSTRIKSRVDATGITISDGDVDTTDLRETFVS